VISKENKDIKSRHQKIARPEWGKWARNEMAIYGTTCGEVRQLVEAISNAFPERRIAYLDESHNEESAEISGFDTYTIFGKSCSVHFREIDKQNILLGDCDLLLVNGNHFSASRQMVVVNESKESSLRKRAEQLTNVQFILNSTGKNAPSYLGELVPNVQDMPVFPSVERNSDLEKILFPPAKLKALVLTGGKSERMGVNKSLIEYHGEPQFQWLANEIESLSIPVYLSVASKELAQERWPEIPDSFLNLGPMGGLLSAFQSDPDAAWLIVAVDMPVIEKHQIQKLIEARAEHQHATCYLNTENELPEPLFSIWEPSSYPLLLQLMSRGISCPRKALINMQRACMLKTDDVSFLSNANTPEESKRFTSK
jgi:molybdopterin-guanine dinucleotide biosynthesis protein A